MLGGYISIHAGTPHVENSATPKHPVGTKAVTPDGRIFRYFKNGATATEVGKLYVAADLTTAHEDAAFQTAGVIGDNKALITIATTSIVANEYDGGYLCIIDDTGEGYTHLIEKHGAGTGTITFYIKPRLLAATTTSTTIQLVRNPWSGVVISDGTQSDVPVGVAVKVVTANYFGWIQTGGICGLLQDETGTAGKIMTIGSSASGATEDKDALTEKEIGYLMAGVNTTDEEYAPVFLTIDK